jgi:hypothetical protein
MNCEHPLPLQQATLRPSVAPRDLRQALFISTNHACSSWTRNTDLEELDPTVVRDLVTPKMRKDLAGAHILAEEAHDIEYYKQVLREFQEAKIADQEAKAARAKAKKEKSQSKKVEQAEPDEDVEMADADAPEEAEEVEVKKSKTKKRKAEDEVAVSISQRKRDPLSYMLISSNRRRSAQIQSRSPR